MIDQTLLLKYLNKFLDEKFVFEENPNNDTDDLEDEQHKYLVQEYAKLIRLYDLGHVEEYLYGGELYVKWYKDSKCDLFKSNNGFEEHFINISSEKDHLNDVRTKDKNLAKLSKWQVKTFWWFFSFAIVNFGIGVFLFISNQKLEEDLKSFQKNISKIQKSLAVEKTSTSTQKKDSLSIHVKE